MPLPCAYFVGYQILLTANRFFEPASIIICGLKPVSLPNRYKRPRISSELSRKKRQSTLNTLLRVSFITLCISLPDDFLFHLYTLSPLFTMPPAPNISQAEWDRHRREIIELYMTPKMTLKKVMTHMGERHNFRPRLLPRTSTFSIRLQLIFPQQVSVRNNSETVESTKKSQ